MDVGTPLWLALFAPLLLIPRSPIRSVYRPSAAKGAPALASRRFSPVSSRVTPLRRIPVLYSSKSSGKGAERSLGKRKTIKGKGGQQPDQRLRRLLESYGIREVVISSLESQAITPEIAPFLSDLELEELKVKGDDLILFKKAINKKGSPTQVVYSQADLERLQSSVLADQEDLDDWDDEEDAQEMHSDGDEDFLDDYEAEDDLRRGGRNGRFASSEMSRRRRLFSGNEQFEEEELDDDFFHGEGEKKDDNTRSGSEVRKVLLKAGEGVDVDRNFIPLEEEDYEEIGYNSRMMNELRNMGMIRKALPGLPKPRKIRISSSKYVGSSKSIHFCPPPRFIEFAVIGRSNVGKSSLINALTGNLKLASVSKQPGKTKSINHYLIDDKWYLVDLPGYGYAKVKKTERFGWHKATKQFFMERNTLALVMLLVDSSITPQQIDLDCAYWLGEAQIPFILVFTKTDKKAKKGAPKPAENIKAFTRIMSRDWENVPAYVATSSAKGEGLPELLTYLAQVRELFQNEVRQGFWTQAREREKIKKFGKRPPAKKDR